MTKYTVTRKRILTEEASIVVELKDGQTIADAVAAVSDKKWKWSTVTETPLSTDVEPVVEIGEADTDGA